MIITHKAVNLHGTNGGNAPCSKDLVHTQISIKGRTSGILTVTARSNGGHDFEPFATPLTIDLSTTYTVILDPASLEALNFAVSAPGDTFDVTISQWFTQ